MPAMRDMEVKGPHQKTIIDEIREIWDLWDLADAR